MAKKIANTGRALGSVLRLKDDVYVPPSSASSSIYVTGFQATTTSDALISHFQNEKNGGGIIFNIMISERGAAVITFDSPEGKT